MTSKETIDAYSKYAKKWAEIIRSGKSNAHEYIEKPAMRKELPNLRGKKVLCLGCGTGEEVEYLTSLKAEVIGIDISQGLIDFAKKSFPDLDFRVMSIDELDFEEESFDFVYSSLVVHYMPSWQKTFKGVFKVLKSNGTFLFSAAHPIVWGGERPRTEDTRVSILGYEKDKKNKTFKVYGDYLDLRKIEDIWFKDFKVAYYHRPLSEIFDDIISSGLTLEKFIEPKAIDAARSVDPIFWGIHQKIPLFMIIKLRKDISE